DGRVDVLFTYAPCEAFRSVLIGIETKPSQHTFPAGTVMLGVSLKPLGIEYLTDISIAGLINQVQRLPDHFWDINREDLDDFEAFCQKMLEELVTQAAINIDNRKRELFNLIYTSNGTMPVQELSEKVYWSRRQINRYFNNTFGLALKTFCKIIRFRASLSHIERGILFPEQDFSDQSHFIKEIKKFAGVTPKKLADNKNDRFLQLSVFADY